MVSARDLAGEPYGRIARSEPTAVAAGQTRQCQRPPCGFGLHQYRPNVGSALGPRGSRRKRSVGLGRHRAAAADRQGVPSCPREPREPIRGASVFRFRQTGRDPFRALLQVSGSLSDSLKPSQTPYS